MSSESLDSTIAIEPSHRVLVCQHQSCLRNGADATLQAFQALTTPESNSEFKVESSGCLGQCNIGPTVRVLPDETWYAWVKPSDVPKIVQQHLQKGQPVQEKLNPRIHGRFFG
ncbi:MAG: (2Fe-2S) ferredoxin domain-containing protein [Oscillatoriales cyanobacterium RM1_1_9]|nr:(2Fe-2S) ferredoxin domain-containing protein [Oscillatoriales cyanobacterium SM2_3_0]NJO45993.1 (2Fe-2S) ferredoxin domain-containing protein [Oscillatoriales cyanobacterium RM2_1_1]NJO70568.1 (2Fe-2S) ferredoxin domain-containing protein [Oscillatoriales cyanobacterium RM1_1_9]